MAPKRMVVALTGGPGGGKSTLVQYMQADPRWAGRFVALPEAVLYAWRIGLDPGDALFQRTVVAVQCALEEAADGALGPGDRRPILCHRGTLDALGFWLQQGGQADDFFEGTATTRAEQYQRYDLVLHMVTNVIDVERAHTRWAELHNPPAENAAVQLDGLLGEVWGDHPHYFRLDNRQRDWPMKYAAACEILGRFWPQ